MPTRQMRTHVRHIRQAQAEHRALRHDTVAALRAAHAQTLERLAPHLQRYTSAYASELSRLRDASEDDTATVPLTWVRTHIQQLRPAVKSGIRDFATAALAITLAAKRDAAYQAQRDAALAIHKAVQRVPPEKRPPHATTYAPADAGAIQSAVNTTGNDEALSTLYDGIDDEADDEVQRATTTAALQGRDDTWLRLALLAALRISLDRALTIGRNEPLACYRDVQLSVYLSNSRIVRGWVWHAQLSGCCLACALMHGSVHDLDEEMQEHVCGRCEMVPLAEGDDSDNGNIESGYDWLQRQDEGVLQDKMSASAYRAYVAGDVALDQFLKVADDPQWGKSIYVASLKELGLDAGDYVD